MFVSAEEAGCRQPQRGGEALHGAPDEAGEEERPPPARRDSAGGSLLSEPELHVADLKPGPSGNSELDRATWNPIWAQLDLL